MILKGSKRGGAVELGKHLLKAENEHVEVHEIRGFVADDVISAFQEAYAISRGTKCCKFLFSLSLSPPEKESVSINAFEDAIEAIEAKLGLTGQPRVIIFHEKEARRHCHCVWSRINADTMTAIDQPHFKLKLQDISRKLYLEHGWQMPDGLIDAVLRNPINFDREEWFQAQRTGQDPRIIKAAFQRCWQISDSGRAFRSALEQRGYYLAKGDRRSVVAVDMHGEVYAVSRWTNVRTKDVSARMSDVDALPSIASVQERVTGLVQEKVSGFIGGLTSEFAKTAQALEANRVQMVEQHRAARRELEASHNERQVIEAKHRAERFRSGLLGLWDRISGRHAELRKQNELEVAACAKRDALEKQQLIDTQLAERQNLQREIKNERRLHARELTRTHRFLRKERFEMESSVNSGRSRHRHGPIGP